MGTTGASVGGKGGDPHASHVLETQLSTWVGTFLAHDHTHTFGPRAQVHDAGEFRDPRSVPDLALSVQGRTPRLLGHCFEEVGGVVGQCEAERVGQATAGEPRGEVVGGTRPVGADKDALVAPPLG